MARGLQNYPNRTTPNSDFPNGEIADNDGTGTGTPVNNFTNGDIHQFLARALRRAGITPNGLKENDYSGHQYHQALDIIIQSFTNPLSSNKADKAQSAWVNLSLINGWATSGGLTPQYRIDQFGQIHLRGQLDGTGASSAVFVGVSGAPFDSGRDIELVVRRYNGSSQEVTGMEVRSDGRLQMISSSSNNTVYLDGISYWIN